MNSLYINVCLNEGQYFVDVKTFVIIFVYKFASPCNLRLIVSVLEDISSSFIQIDLDNLKFETGINEIRLSQLCVWPIIVLNSNQVVSGVCSVARQICKLSEKTNVRQLLGFREACLVACAESSVWTKFCEIDLICAISDVLNNNSIKNGHFAMPVDILKYENHLSQPVRIHNIYKIARNTHNDQSLKSSTPREDLQVAHDYAEGPYMTLADLILYPCFQLFYKYCREYYSLNVEPKLPLVTGWVSRTRDLKLLDFSLRICKIACDGTIIVPKIDNVVSLYKADPAQRGVKHTKQYKIEFALNLINGNIKSDVSNKMLPFGYENDFNWNEIPLEATPEGGALPAKRANRKREQLENLVKATLAVVDQRKCLIVDFCSGSGHLGILVALILPHCEVVLVENKERSLDRARETIFKLKLNNVVLVQSNLDYFVGGFDVGLALHACGVATDLVIQMCIKRKADFICCPCCYGGIKECHQVTYPRSAKFREAFKQAESHYFNLAHAADQTHEQENSKTQQGYFCMDVIDNDRRLDAEDRSYKVHLGKLHPVTCTNKNNLLVGLYNNVNK